MKEVRDMKNIDMIVEEQLLIIKIDLSKSFGPSASGKTTIIASTEGNQPIDSPHKAVIGLNVYKRRS
jgi:ABC-type polar amino acid transport system ATPase subunit